MTVKLLSGLMTNTLLLFQNASKFKNSFNFTSILENTPLFKVELLNGVTVNKFRQQ